MPSAGIQMDNAFLFPILYRRENLPPRSAEYSGVWSYCQPQTTAGEGGNTRPSDEEGAAAADLLQGSCLKPGARVRAVLRIPPGLGRRVFSIHSSVFSVTSTTPRQPPHPCLCTLDECVFIKPAKPKTDTFLRHRLASLLTQSVTTGITICAKNQNR